MTEVSSETLFSLKVTVGPEMESSSWNENSDFLRDQLLRENMNLWSHEPANSQYK
jgi:hypothetical protein